MVMETASAVCISAKGAEWLMGTALIHNCRFSFFPDGFGDLVPFRAWGVFTDP
jgi:hypothetical protein